MAKVTKNDMVDDVHQALEVFGYSRRKIFDMVETLLETIKYSLERSNDVLISGFRKFCVKEKKPGKAGILPPVKV